MAVTAQPAAPMRAGVAALVTAGIVLLVAGFVAVGSVLGLVPIYAGFLLLWFLANVDMLELGALPALAIGAVCGTLTSWLLQVGLATWGPIGAAPALAVIVMAIFCQLCGHLPIAINRAYMLYVTAMSAPLLLMHERFDRVLLVLGVATVYFGGVVAIGRLVVSMRRARA